MSLMIERLEQIRIDNLNAAKVYREALAAGGNPSNRELARSVENIQNDLTTIAWVLKRLVDPTSD